MQFIKALLITGAAMFPLAMVGRATQPVATKSYAKGVTSDYCGSGCTSNC